MHEQHILGRGRIGQRREIFDVGNALFLVDQQIEDEIEVFGLGLRHQIGGLGAIGAAIVHVHMHIAAQPAGKARRQCRACAS